MQCDSKCRIMGEMKTKPLRAIRISETEEVKKALRTAKTYYPTLSDAEIFKLGLAKIVTGDKNIAAEEELEEIRLMAAQSVGHDYLADPEEDIYKLGMGKKVNFK